jgi:protein TonB
MSLKKSLTPLHVAVVISVAVHAGLLIVLLLWRNIDPQSFNRMFEDTALEVILVNSRSADAPVKPQAIAQANLVGGGEADSGRATSPLPSSLQTELGDASEELRRNSQMERLQEAQQQLLLQLRRELAAMPDPTLQRDSGNPQQQAQEEQRRQKLQLLAEIEKRINEENSRPKKRHVSPDTREEVYAIYYDKWRHKIEERGTRNFPESHGRRLHGVLTMSVTIDTQGRVVEAKVLASSNNPVLDRQAIAIVHAAAPFGALDENVRRQWDQLVLTARFSFTRDEKFEATMVAPQ